MYPDARHTLYIECLLTRELGMDNMAMQTVFAYVAHLSAGKPAKVFGYIPDCKETLICQTTASFTRAYT